MAEYLGAPVINVGALETAEMVKLAGMVYRNVNIALANELARYCEAAGIDFPAVVQAANNDGEANLLHAGIGVGGHCTPVYPHFLFQESERFGVHAPLAELGRLLNDQQPAKVLDRLEREWQPLRGKRVLILGLGFRPQVKEDACSPAYTLAAELARRRARAELHDPLYTPDEIRNRGFSPGAFAVKGARWKTLGREEGPMHELLILNTAHAAYADLDFKKARRPRPESRPRRPQFLESGAGRKGRTLLSRRRPAVALVLTCGNRRPISASKHDGDKPRCCIRLCVPLDRV